MNTAENQQQLMEIEAHCLEFLSLSNTSDSAHDLNHIRRVVSNAKNLLIEEKADNFTVVVAAWLHDCVSVAKNSPMRSQASRMAAEKAKNFLKQYQLKTEKIHAIVHAIEAHSFSAKIVPETIEAKIVQDADRLDAIGAVGIARCFLTAGSLGTMLYSNEDPFCLERTPNDSLYTIDHFYQKLLQLPAMMNTSSAKEEACRRVSFMKEYLARLRLEIAC